MKPGLNSVGLVLKNYCTLLWSVFIIWKYNSNTSGTCAAYSKGSFRSSSGCYTPFSRMATLGLNHSLADESGPKKPSKIKLGES